MDDTDLMTEFAEMLGQWTEDPIRLRAIGIVALGYQGHDEMWTSAVQRARELFPHLTDAQADLIRGARRDEAPTRRRLSYDQPWRRRPSLSLRGKNRLKRSSGQRQPPKPLRYR
jgi:hypothetical protein